MLAELGRLTIADIDLALSLARVRSIRELARRAGLEASQVSRAIARVERVFGERLFERSVSGVVPTARGRQVIERFEEVQSLLAEARGERRARDAHVSIGATAFFSTRLVAPAVCEMGALLAPEACRLLDVAPDDLVGSGIRGAFVAAVHMDKLDWPRTWATRRLGSLRWRLYARRGHPLAGVRTLRESHLSEHAFVYPLYWTPTGFAYGNDSCPLRREQRRAGTATATADAAVEVVAGSDQLAFLPEIVGRDDARRGRIVELTVKDWRAVERDVHLSVRADAVSKSLFEALGGKMAGVLGRPGRR